MPNWEFKQGELTIVAETLKKLMLGRGPLKLFRDRSNTFKVEDGLKIDARSIRPSNLFILKFLKNNLHFQHTIKFSR
jgi:hypothetical protein